MNQKLSNLEKEQLKSVALPIWKNIVEASRDEDYARFSRGFSSELRAKLSEEHFRISCQEIPLLTACAFEPVVKGFQTGEGVPYSCYPKFQAFMTELSNAKHEQVLVQPEAHNNDRHARR